VPYVLESNRGNVIILKFVRYHDQVRNNSTMILHKLNDKNLSYKFTAKVVHFVVTYCVFIIIFHVFEIKESQNNLPFFLEICQ